MYLINQIIYLIAVIYSMHRIIKLDYTKKLVMRILVILSLPIIYLLYFSPLLVFFIEILIVVFVFFGEKIRVILISFLSISCLYTIMQLFLGVIGQFFSFNELFINLISAVLVVLLMEVIGKIEFLRKLKYDKSIQNFVLNVLINLILITLIFVIIYRLFDTIPLQSLIILLVFVAIFTVSSQIVTYQYIQNSNKLNQNKLLFEIQKHSYENSMVKYKERLSFLHDINAYISSLNRMLNSDDIQNAIQLINEMSGELKKNRMVYSNNEYINLIINEFETRFKDNFINFNYSEIIMGEINIESMDIISLFYNIISNALEAAKNSESKTITINVKLDENILYIDCINSVHSNFNIDTIKIGETTKEDKDLHGIGLLNLNKIIKKYSGNIEWSTTDNGMFKLEIFILI